MASYQDLEFDWSMLCQDSTDCWTASDLQLAAELGKTLLERNKELENSLKQHQNVIEDQTQEIEYLTKQTAALREVNDSRLRIYEQLEVSIQDLERANQRLALDNSADKKHIKSLCLSIDSLEARCEELQRNLDEVTLQQDSYRRRQQRKASVCSNTASVTVTNGTGPSAAVGQVAPDNDVDMREMADDEEVINLLGQLQELRSQRTKEQRKVAELEEQMATMLKDNFSLEEQLSILQQKEADMKSMQEEISTLEAVRQGHLCGRCLRHVDGRGQDELSSILMDHEEEEDASVVNSLISETHRSTVMLQIGDPAHHPHYDNPYRVLVEKYEALVQMQRPNDCKRHSTTANSLSLQEELQMSGDFNSFTTKDGDQSDAVVPNNKERSNTKNIQRNGAPAGKTFSMTPTDFSEAETSSSGFSDETSNKMTQTDTDPPPGSFLCSIADGNDCRFSIYDDANPVESRFRKKPQYRQLFREIFDVLKRAAENKDEGEQLPLLDDILQIVETPKVPPVTPAREDLPLNFPSRGSIADSFVTEDDTKSIAEELAAITHSLPDESIKMPESKTASAPSAEQQALPVTKAEAPKKSPPKQDILEYLSIGVGIKKKSNSKKNSPSKSMKTSVAERVERIESPLVGSAAVSYANKAGSSRKRRDSRFAERLTDSAPSSRPQSPGTFGAWYNREGMTTPNNTPPAPGQQQSVWEYKPYLSSASQEVAKLKRLEKSYAEVLRLGPQSSHRPMSINGYRRH